MCVNLTFKDKYITILCQTQEGRGGEIIKERRTGSREQVENETTGVGEEKG